MPQRIQAPDGSVVEFPDGMSEAQISDVMRREYGGPDNRRKSFGLGFDKAFGRIVDNSALVMDKGLRTVGVPTDQINHAMGMPSTREQVALNRQRIAEQEQTARPGFWGGVAGGGVAMAPMAAATKNPFILGGAEGALSSEGDSPGQVATDAAIGAGLGYVGGRAVEGVANVFAPVVDPIVKRVAGRGIKLTPGMTGGKKAMAREDRLASKPVVGDAIRAARARTQETFNTASVNEALAPLGKKVPAPVKPGHDAVDWAHTEVSREYDRVVPNLAVRIDGRQFAEKIAPAAQSLPAKQQKELQRIVSVNLKGGQLAGQELKNAQGEIRRLATTYRTSASAEDRLLGDALGEVDDELTGAMLAQNPEWAPQLQRVNAAYRGLKIVEDAASRADEGMMSTGQLRQAVRRGDRSRGKSQTARGKSYMQEFSEDARAVIPARVGDSGTAGRLQQGNIFATAGGAVDLARFKGSELLNDLQLAPRPQAFGQIGQGVRRLKRPGSVGAAGVIPASRTDR